MSGIEKICVICREDCGSRPRVKDAHGRYACRACLENRSRAASSRTVSEADDGERNAGLDIENENGDGGDVGDEFWANLPGSDSGGERCPSCGSPVVGGAVVCLACGTNVRTGESTATRVRRQPGLGRKAAGAVGTAVATPVLWTLGGLLGGLIGAVAWALIRGHLNFELGIVAWGVGLLAGAGVYIGSRGRGGTVAGAFAALVALVCVAAGKWGGAAIVAERLSGEASRFDAAHMELSHLADEIAWEWEGEQGRALEWPADMDADIAVSDYAYWPDGYPIDVQQEARRRWEALTPEERQDRVDATAAVIDAFGPLTVFLSDLALIDLLWVVFATGSAFKLGAGSET